ncbi:MAG: hypothetical protein KC912_15460 [Proteobacteria bacterium]|nr:hypothetical protein [Pseudomonadota bacterium]
MRFLFFFILLVPALSLAGPRDSSQARVLEIDFETVDVVATLQGPQALIIQERERPTFDPMTRLREHFKVEIRESVDVVK